MSTTAATRKDDFDAFFRYKSLDVLTNGQYKKHLTQCKENSDNWAMEIHAKQNRVQQLIKSIHSKISAISKSNLGLACRNVTNCAQPPVRMFLGFTTCYLTGVCSDKCLDISKNGKRAQDIHVHCKFAYFFLFLWYVCKLEYVVRACAKKWADSKGIKKNTAVDDALMDLFMQQNTDLCHNLFLVFDKAHAYVQKSLDKYYGENKIEPILQPPASFFHAQQQGDAKRARRETDIWQRIRRPFRYPECTGECDWEVYDATCAGCRRCGRSHVCAQHVFEGDCALVQCDDGSRVCSITGYVIPEVRYAKEEYMDHVVFSLAKHPSASSARRGSAGDAGARARHADSRHHHHLYAAAGAEFSHADCVVSLENEVSKYIDFLLDSQCATRCRKDENGHQSKKLCKSFIKNIRAFKQQHPEHLPNICTLLTSTMHNEKRISFISPVSTELKRRCQRNILLCILDLKHRGYKVVPGPKLQDLVCGLTYLLRTGICYRNHELLSPVPEIARCLPMESRLMMYFKINSKVITSVENEIKLAFRDFLQG